MPYPAFPCAAIALALLLIAGCATAPAPAQASGTIEAINHTHWAINRFSVDGRNAVDIIGPYQGGGGACCFAVPEQWRPGMTVRVDWETGASGVSNLAKEFPGYADWPRYVEWSRKVNAQKRQHSQVVPVPDYGGQETCGITVHFLPCDQLKVTTSCLTYGHPNYPIKEALRLPEPTSCPK
ncbi:Protein of unknown function [Pseudomonas delhiensis]|uniref:DUF3304 domain-containing protein n=1 Tax=Pseudomonas delhiensis TaxID=366289 RepID=A0A239M377_9PSED|nr:DUF3304 domain-containing protein [Pseudomonas delhiensis]SDJ38884.1 Protein of unknown function [Pseudomonas delhiensis]SNT36588.1 Protein of unknown function [Pseudomonas delhiensis]